MFNFVYQKECFQYKTEKVNSTIEFCIFELAWVPNFNLNSFLNQLCPKEVILVKSGNSEHHHWILHVRISLGTKLLIKLTTLVWFCFFPQICPKREFPVQNGKISLVRASMVVTYYIKIFRTGAVRHNGILMSPLLLSQKQHTKQCKLQTLQEKFWKIIFFAEQVCLQFHYTICASGFPASFKFLNITPGFRKDFEF